ncbi:unnamed protein product [Rangifer tarandus platyrhynchus]|uniref:Uncharacterized protein n=1 Tax=Rangifer tarandus platyrhynchus TaxID=3082113 RepID=A0AC59ZMQ7_RANTA
MRGKTEVGLSGDGRRAMELQRDDKGTEQDMGVKTGEKRGCHVTSASWQHWAPFLFIPPLTSRIQHPFTNQSASEGVERWSPGSRGTGWRLAHMCPGNRQTDVAWAVGPAGRGLVSKHLQEADSQTPTDQRASGEVQVSEEKLRDDTGGKNTGLDALERIRGTWPASPLPPTA